MRDTLLDIRRKLVDKAYVNEEHIRFSLVARILEKLDWNIWDPTEVYTEFVPVRNEDNKKVDIALFVRPNVPGVFIEVKADGKILTNLAATEIQLRDYNKNISAPFAIITDGRNWMFYFAMAAGEFSQKCFAKFNLVEDDIEDIERHLETFLSKSEITSDRAELEAKRYLKLNEKQRAMGDCLPEAKRLTSEHPYPRLPNALLDLIKSKGFEATIEEVEDFIGNSSHTNSSGSNPPPRKPEPKNESVRPASPSNVAGTRRLNPENPESLLHTKMVEGHFSGVKVLYWSHLIQAAIKLGYERGLSLVELRHFGNLSQGSPQDKSFSPIAGTDLFLQGMDAVQCWKKSFGLAKKLRVEIFVHFRWSNSSGAAHPGEEAVLEWGPGK